MHLPLLIAPLSLIAMATQLAAQDMSTFETGPVFEDFGPHAPVEEDFAIPDDIDLFVAFDTATAAEDGKINRTIESAARFVNMHAATGIEPARVRAAVVVHGRAAFDLLSDGAWAAKGREGTNPTAVAILKLVDEGVRVILCGQSAAAQGITNDDLAPGVEMALSAMTAHAVLQRQGYTVNPF